MTTTSSVQTSYKTILCDIHDGIARITLNRPQSGNAIELEMAQDLMRAATACEQNSSVRAVVFSGAGNSFSTGGDLKVFSAQGENLPAYLREVTSYLHSAVSRLSRLHAPVIAAVHGVAAGAGFSLMCGADVVLAAESTKFMVAYTKVGLSPDGGATYSLPRIVGLRRATELVLLNRMLSAAEACEWGLVTEVVKDAELTSRTNEVATLLAAGPTQSFGAAKRLLDSSWGQPLETQMELESRAISQAGATADGREGIAAFLEKRRPRFCAR